MDRGNLSTFRWSALWRVDVCLGTWLSLFLIAASWRGWLPYDLTETFGFITGAACVYLIIIENVWNFPVGIVNNVFLLIVFGLARLDGNAGLQVVYVLLGFHGWYCWLFGGKNRTALHVERASWRLLTASGLFILIGTVGLALVFHWLGGASPVLDAFTTVASLAAQYLLNRKCIENWLVWIVVDALSIYLFIAQDLHLTAILYLVYLGMCIVGLRSWLRTLQRRLPSLKAVAS